MNILHAWTVYSVNKVVKNPKHITPIIFSSKPNIYSCASQASSLEFAIQISNCGILDYLLVMQMGRVSLVLTTVAVLLLLPSM